MPKKQLSKKFLVIAFLAVFFIGLSAGLIIQKYNLKKKNLIDVEGTQLQHLDLSLINQALESIENNYYNSDQLDYQELTYGAIRGIANNLDDNYTAFFNPKEAEIFQEDLSGNIEGVGMEVGIQDGQLTVITPLEGTPADQAGLLPQDKIIAVNGSSTADMSLDEAVNLIRGPKGSTVTLSIARNGEFEKKDFSLTRDVIEIPIVEWHKKAGHVAHIRVFHFTNNLSSSFKKVATEILNDPEIDSVVLDLRNNPGGYLGVAQDIAGWFIEEGKIVTTEKGNQHKVFKAEGNEKFKSYSVNVLINKGSASGAEILAAALRENRGTKLIGETSFGKGTIQEIHPLYNGSMLKITTTEWLTPNGNSINEVGLKPDIAVEMPAQNINTEKDTQLQKAINLLENN